MISPETIDVAITPSFFPERTTVCAGVKLTVTSTVDSGLQYRQCRMLEHAVEETRRSVWDILYGDLRRDMCELQSELQFLLIELSPENQRVLKLEDTLRRIRLKLQYRNVRPNKIVCHPESPLQETPETFSTPPTPQEKGASQDPLTCEPSGTITTPSTGAEPEPLKAFQTVSQ